MRSLQCLNAAHRKDERCPAPLLHPMPHLFPLDFIKVSLVTGHCFVLTAAKQLLDLIPFRLLHTTSPRLWTGATEAKHVLQRRCKCFNALTCRFILFFSRFLFGPSTEQRMCFIFTGQRADRQQIISSYFNEI